MKLAILPFIFLYFEVILRNCGITIQKLSTSQDILSVNTTWKAGASSVTQVLIPFIMVYSGRDQYLVLKE